MAAKNKMEADLARQLDFFHENTVVDDKSKKEAESDSDSDMDSDSDSEDIPLAIKTKEDALKQRQRLDTKVKGDDIPLPIASFHDLKSRFNMHKNLIKNLERQNFSLPTPIQSEAIPIMLYNRDLVACAPTGSGKTLAFAIPVVQSLKQHENIGIRCLIITPTKELASQIYMEFVKLSKGRDLNICVLNKSQAAKIAKNAEENVTNAKKFDILITTPLRLRYLIDKGYLDLSHVKHFILDEADKLLEDGFIDQTGYILEKCTNPELQKSLFSATIPSGVEKIAEDIMFSPVRVIVGKKEGANVHIDQKVVYSGNEHGKLIAIRQMIQSGELTPPCIIFVQSVQRAKALYHELIYDKVNVDVIHGERTQVQREKAISKFKSGEIWVLICTDVLARGIDFRGVNLIINYDVPESAQAYIHRIGRTGRAGRTGKAITFFTKKDGMAIRAVANVMKQSGCEVADWMTKLRKANYNDRQRMKKKPVERDEISTLPKFAKEKRKQKFEEQDSNKKQKLDENKRRIHAAKKKDTKKTSKKSILDEDDE